MEGFSQHRVAVKMPEDNNFSLTVQELCLLTIICESLQSPEFFKRGRVLSSQRVVILHSDPKLKILFGNCWVEPIFLSL